MARDKYEVVPFNSGRGFFIHGGGLGEMFIQNESDACLIAQALNHAHRIKMKTTMRKVDDALYALEQLSNSLKADNV